MGCLGNRAYYTIHGEGVPIFRKDCNICWIAVKKRITGMSLYNLVVRHSHDRKEIEGLVPASQNITAFPNTVKQS